MLTVILTPEEDASPPPSTHVPELQRQTARLLSTGSPKSLRRENSRVTSGTEEIHP